ncbi:MAG TPA: NAD(P)/FAD-dependent oxidoreductase, partial [Dongiaceae bacterium]|nr:NAD(P)/FAD-dependent oxidoreductase [Dongiaceae bacterium]
LDLVIIGAGAAGIGAARAAAKAGLSYRLVEASHRIGGRAYTEDIAPGVPFDLGCHWLHFAESNPLVPEADRLGFTIDRSFFFTTRAWIDGRLTDAAESAEYEAYFGNTYAGFAAASHGTDVDALSTIDTESRWFRPFAHVFTVINAAEADQVSALDIASYPMEGSDWPVKEGFGRLVAKLGADLSVSLNTIVEEIDWSARDHVTVRTNKGEITARATLITVSIGILQSGMIRFRPALPAKTRDAIGGFLPGSANRIALHFDRDVFDDAPGNFTIVDGDAEPLAIYIPPFGFNYIVGQTGGNFSTHLTRAGQSAAIDYMMERTVSVFGAGVRKHFTRAIVSAWDTDPWVLGAYAAVKPGHFGARDILAQPVDDRLFFAGEAVAMPMVATCGGAFMSGTRAIGQIAGKLQTA